MTEKKELQEKKDKKNVNFVQFNRAAMAAHRQLVLKNPLAAAILDFLIEHMDRSNAVICSYKVLQEITGYSRSSIGRSLKLLKDDNWVQSVRVGKTDAYMINSAAYWTTWGNKKQYSTFHATIIASASEQLESIEAMQNIELKRMPIMSHKDVAIVDPEETLPPPDQTDLDLV